VVYWYADRSDDNSSERVMKDAACLIASEIRDMKYSNDVYPCVVEIGKVSEDNQPFPLSLLLFIQSIARSSRLKQVAVAQALIQAARPQSCLMPLLFGLSVQLDHEFGLEFLLQQLSRLGFSLSYDRHVRLLCAHVEKVDCTA